MVIAPVTGADAGERARRELDRGEYHRDDPGPVQHVLDWIADRIGDLFGGGTGGNTVLLLLVLIVGVTLVFAVRAGRPTLRRRSSTAGVVDPLAPSGSRDHRRAAQAAEAAGDLDDALREWLRAAVATIEERGILPPRPGRTGAATAREAGPALPAVAADLAAAVAAFDEVWFGGRRAGEPDVRLAREVADAVARARLPQLSTPAAADPATPW